MATSDEKGSVDHVKYASRVPFKRSVNGSSPLGCTTKKVIQERRRGGGYFGSLTLFSLPNFYIPPHLVGERKVKCVGAWRNTHIGPGICMGLWGERSGGDPPTSLPDGLRHCVGPVHAVPGR
ncbi:hypothetical protein GCM10010840_14440 [Deinococcus aerolatus]|uniref:Uncharacterized protein n=1 Tax=Deinococcus aerolatus TaxID=522487 RepID=A0ABQ2G6N0_9DEIO|nr:hypothetical protein GCM10010840_14440 [Deinococcus aerolatus]